MKNRLNKLLGISSITAFALLAHSVVNAEDLKTVQSEKIVTVGSGFETSFKDENKNTLVIDKKSFEAQAFGTISDALKFQPLVNITYGYFGPSIDLRGQGKDAGVAVKILVDRVPLNLLDNNHSTSPINLIDVEDVEQIEVIPGGGAVVYGSGTRGGVVNIVTKNRMRDYYSVAVNGKLPEGPNMFKDNYFGSLNMGVGQKIGESLFIKAAGKISNRAGYRYGENQMDAYANLGLIFKINDNAKFDAGITYSYSKYRTYGFNQTIDQVKKDRRSIPAPAPASTRGMSNGGGGTSGQTPTLIPPKATVTEHNFLTAQLGYNQKVDNFTLDVLGYYMQDSIMNIATRARSPHSNLGGSIKGKLDGTSNMLMAGIDSFYQMKDTIYSGLKISRFANSAYVYDSFKFSDNFSLAGGVRYEISAYKYQNLSKKIDVDAESVHNYAAEITPSYKINDNSTAYFKYERGFISPSVAQKVNKLNDVYYDNRDLKSEKYDQYELGFRSYMGEHYFSANVFANMTHNEMMVAWRSGNHGSMGYFYWNEKLTGRLGLELVGKQYFDSLELTEGFTYTYAKILDTNTHTPKNKGQRLSSVPEFKANFNIAWYIFKNNETSLKLMLNNVYTSSYLDSGFIKVDGFYLGDISMSYMIKGLNIAVGVRNFTDTLNWAYISQGRTFGGYLADAPRTYYADLRYQF